MIGLPPKRSASMGLTKRLTTLKMLMIARIRAAEPSEVKAPRLT